MLPCTSINSRKSQGMPINVVVIAAIALIILLVLIGIFTGKIKWFGQGLATCPGACMSAVDCQNLEAYDLGSQYVNKGDTKVEGKCSASEICCSSKKTA